MNRAVDEKWTIETDEVGEYLALPDDNGFPVGVRGPWTHDGQLRIASAAPDMARVLLAIEWSSSDEDGSECPSCHARAYVPPPRYDADGKYLGYTEGTHEPDCAWGAAIRKAGIR